MHYTQSYSSPLLGSCPSLIIPYTWKHQCTWSPCCPVHLQTQTHILCTHLPLPLAGLNMHIPHLNHHHFPNCRLRCPRGSTRDADYSDDRLLGMQDTPPGYYRHCGARGKLLRPQTVLNNPSVSSLREKNTISFVQSKWLKFCSGPIIKIKNFNIYRKTCTLSTLLLKIEEDVLDASKTRSWMNNVQTGLWVIRIFHCYHGIKLCITWLYYMNPARWVLMHEHNLCCTS